MRTTPSDIPASLPGSHGIYKAVLPSASTENLARRAPTIKGKLAGPLLAKEAALAAQTHLRGVAIHERKEGAVHRTLRLQSSSRRRLGSIMLPPSLAVGGRER